MGRLGKQRKRRSICRNVVGHRGHYVIGGEWVTEFHAQKPKNVSEPIKWSALLVSSELHALGRQEQSWGNLVAENVLVPRIPGHLLVGSAWVT